MVDYWVDSHSGKEHGSRLFTIHGGSKTIASMHALDGLPDLLHEWGVRRPIILTDTGVAGSGVLELILSILGTDIPPVATITDIPYDSDLITVSRTAEQYLMSDADGIIALGGGSVIHPAYRHSIDSYGCTHPCDRSTYRACLESGQQRSGIPSYQADPRITPLSDD